MVTNTCNSRYALVDGVRKLPQKGMHGICEVCGGILIAHCGRILIEHWAHQTKVKCDTWWEPLSPWHIAWQDEFPESSREVIFRDKETGEVHRADVHTSAGITIEFQNSTLSLEEMESRNAFYPKLIWVVNASKFAENLSISKDIPDPRWKELEPYAFMGDGGTLGNMIWARKNYLPHGPAVIEYLSLNHPEFREIKAKLQKKGSDCRSFSWRNKRRGWMDSKAPVFFDFGEDILYRLCQKKQLSTIFYYLRLFSKSSFLEKYVK